MWSELVAQYSQVVEYSQRLATAYADVAAFYFRRGLGAEAEDYQRKALEAWEALLAGEVDASLNLDAAADSYDTLARAHLKRYRKRFADAVRFYQQSFEQNSD